MKILWSPCEPTKSREDDNLRGDFPLHLQLAVSHFRCVGDNLWLLFWVQESEICILFVHAQLSEFGAESSDLHDNEQYYTESCEEIISIVMLQSLDDLWYNKADIAHICTKTRNFELPQLHAADPKIRKYLAICSLGFNPFTPGACEAWQ